MKPKPTIRRFFSLILALTFVFSMFPSAHIHAAAADHTCVWSEWSTLGNGTHYRSCTVEGCTESETGNCSGGTATCKEKALCTLCNYYHGELDPNNHHHVIYGYNDHATHRHYCTGCEEVFIESEAHSFGVWEDNGDGTQSRACSACRYYETEDIPHVCTYGEWTSNGNGTHTHTCTEDTSHTETADCSDGSDSDELCDDCGYDLHTHSHSVDYDATHHWKECSCGDEQNKAEHTYSSDTDTTCDCGYTRTIAHNHSWGSWTSNNDGTHTRTCAADNSHTETANCSDGNDDGELCDTCGYDLHTHSYTQTHDKTNHWNVCSCGDKQNEEKHKFTYTFYNNYNHTIGCTDCDLRIIDPHYQDHTGSDDKSHWVACKYCDVQLHIGSHTFDDEYDRYCNEIIEYDKDGNVMDTSECGYDRHTGCAADGDPFGQYSITDTAHERTCEDCGLTVRENHTANTYSGIDAAAHTGICVCGKPLGESAHTWMPASTHSSICFDCGYYLDNHTYTAFKPSEANPETYHVLHCSVCGEMSDPVQVAGHNYEVKYDKDGHWNQCTDCGYTTAKTAHRMTVSRYDGTSLVHINSCSGCEHDEYENCDFKQGTYAGNEDGHWAVCFACGRTHSGIPLQAHVDENADGTCDVCKEKYTPPHTHSYKDKYDSTGHYTECACGEKTEVQAHSYTGMFDSTCDCGYNRGLFVTNDDGKDFFEVGFIPGDDVTLPDDAELVVEEHCPSLAPIASTVVPTAETEYVDIPVNNISRLEDIVDGYKLDEIVVIDGEKYMVCDGYETHDFDNNRGNFVNLIRLSDASMFTYNTRWFILSPSSMTYDVEIQTNRTIVINGTKYDVPATMDYLGIERYVLYVDGVQAGLYFPSGNEADFVEGYDPETLKAQQDDNDLGSVTIPADYNNAAIADLAPGKTYKVSVIGSNDISVEGLTEVNGTVSQTFKIPDALVGAKNVKYVAVHDTNPYAAELAEAERVMKSHMLGSTDDPDAEDAYNSIKELYDKWEEENGSGAEFGTVTVSDDGKIVTVTYAAVDSFSPFIVYAFVEADEPEYKELSATLHTEHTGGTATCKDKAVCETCGEIYGELAAHTYENGACTVCGEAEQTVAPPTNDKTIWFILIAVAAGAVIVLTVVYGKRRKSRVQ